MMSELNNSSVVTQFSGDLFQSARMVDVFLLGPFMLWYASSAKGMPDWARLVMVVSGLMTMGFNLRNYNLVESVRTKGQDPYKTLLRMT